MYFLPDMIQHCVINCVTSQWFSPGTPVSSTNKTDSHDINEILLKVAVNTLTVTVYISFAICMFQALAGSCAGHDCKEGHICTGKTADGRFECKFKCKYFIFYILRFYIYNH